MNVTAEDHEGLDCFGHEGRRLLGVGERVRPRAGRGGAVAGTGRVDLGLDNARIPVVDGTQHGDRAAVLPRVPDEELPLGGRGGLRRLAHPVVTEDTPAPTLWAACATGSLSTKPSIRSASLAGGAWME